MNRETQQATLRDWLKANDLMPATFLHHFVPRHRNTIYLVVSQRRVSVTIIGGVEFISVRETLRYLGLARLMGCATAYCRCCATCTMTEVSKEDKFTVA